jgi:M6 family metalloprotease-like protein
MKRSLRIRLREKAMILPFLILVLAIPGWLFSLEPPTKRQLAKYRLDGTLARRIADAKAFGNDRANPGLIGELQIRLERLRRKALGLSDAEIDGMLPVFPPGIRPGLRNKGNNKVFVLLIDFPDYPSSQTAASINGKIFGDGAGGYPLESLRNYYRRSSYSQLELQGSTLGWYRPAYDRSGVDQTDSGREDLIKEALTYFNGQGHDFSQYDNDNDGVIDYFLVIWTGPPGEWASFWWGYYTSWWDSPFVLDGKQFLGAHYSWQWESYPYPGTFSPDTTIHETGHALGLPDLYDYDDAVGPKGGVGGLDMMDNVWGDHNGFSKMLLDWLTPQVCSHGARTLTLRPTGSHKDAVIFWPNYDIARPFAEFFMVQNRYRVKNDAGLPADGLLIWHIDARLDAGGSFRYDNSYTTHKLVRLMEADGREEIERGYSADAGDYYVAGKSFSKSTTPNSNAYDGSRTNAYLESITTPSSNMTCNISFVGEVLRTAVNNASLGTTRPAPGTYTYGNGADVQIRALPAQYCTFTGWSGDASGKANPVTIHMDGDKSVTANFIPGKALQIAVNNAALGTTRPAPGTHKYEDKANAQVRALPAQYCTFTGWSGDASGKANPVTIHMDRDKRVTASFKLVNPPSNLTAVRLKNRSVTQTENIVDLSWDPNPANGALTIVSYRVYLKAGTGRVKLADLSANGRSYRHRMVPDELQTYGVTAVSSDGGESMSITITK